MTGFTYDEELFSDLHKDAYGFRPRGHWFYDERCTPEDKQAIWDRTIEYLDAEIAHRKEEQARAVAAFEERIVGLIACGAGDRANAIRWLLQAQEDSCDPVGELEYELGLPWRYLKNELGR